VSAAWLLIPVAAAATILLIVMDRGIQILALFAAAFAIAATVRDLRIGFLVAVAMASFVNYESGLLAPELGSVAAWMAFLGLLVFWRSRWKTWVAPPTTMWAPLWIWGAVCVYGVVYGVLAGNNLRFLGIEASGALWPFFGLLVCQAFTRRGLALAGLGLVAIAFLHVAYGLAGFAQVHERLGGLYFTTLPGIVAVGLWTMAWVAPHSRWRLIAFALLIPLLVHQLFSFTRGYWLGILAGITVSSILSWKEMVSRGIGHLAKSAAILGGALAVTLVVVVFAVSALGGADLLGAAGRRMTSSFSTETSVETGSNVMRLMEYSLAIDAGRGAPITGRGLGFSYVFMDPFRGSRTVDRVVHNYYLFLWLKLGVFGVGAFLFFVWRTLRTTIRAARREPDWLGRCWLIMAAAMTVQLLVISSTNYSLNDSVTAGPAAFVWGMAWMVAASGPAFQRRLGQEMATSSQ